MNSQVQRSAEQQQATGLTPAKGQAQSVENWVQCDRCGKWRRVREDLLDDLDDESNWYCEDNPDEHHNHCNVPQEMTNDEIDRGRAMETLAHERMKRQRRPAVWQLIRDNIYTHRKPKKLYEDDIMVCQCKPGSQKGISCQHEDCLNGMLNIECVNGFCPSGKECRNQRFQKRQYSKFEVRRAGLKGFGLFALEHIKKGAFIVEYVGELLDEEEYLRRKEYYHSVGQRHYYFMNIGNGEVVDACRKGNRARFINHSCEPNAETQKWMVKGELKIGFFATKDIPVNTEIQFDYNFERYGDKPTKCHCGAPSCRGFIGGSSDRYVGSAVDDAAMQGLDLAPIMLTAEMKDAKLAPDLELVMDQVVGIGLGEEPANPALDARLQALAAQQGTVWEPSPSPDPPDQPNSAQVPKTAPPLAFARVEPPIPGTAAPLSGPLIQQPLQHLAQLHSASMPAAAAPALPPLSDAALAAAGAPPELLSAATNSLQGAFSTSHGAEVLAAGHGATKKASHAQGQAKGAGKQIVNGKNTGEDTKSGETCMSESDISEEEQISSDSDAGPPAEDDDWLDSADRYKELPGTPPSHPVPVPAAAKRKRTQRPQQPVKRKRTDTNGAHSNSSKDRKDSNVRRRPEHTPSTSSGAHLAAGAAAPGLRSDNDAAISNEPDSAASVATGAQLPIPHGRDTQTQGAQGPAQGKKRKGSRMVVKTLSPAKPLQAGSANHHAHEPSNLKEGSVSAAASASAGPPVATAAASEASASVGNSLKRPAWPKNSAKNASAAAQPLAPRKRSEVERRLEQFVGAGAHKMLRVDAVRDFVRLFNMCDISPPMQQDDDGRTPAGHAMDDSVVSRRRQQSNMETDHQLTHRQRARMADLSLLLEKVLGASGHTLKKELLRCGLLSRLQFCAINNYGMGYTSTLRKICRAVQALPVTTGDIHARRSAQGSFADVLRALTSHGDREVRKRSYALLDAHPQPPEEREREQQEREQEKQERERERQDRERERQERERERRERTERAADRGPDRGWDRSGDDRCDRAERPAFDREHKGNGDRGGPGGLGNSAPDSMYRSGPPDSMHRNHQHHHSIKGPPSGGVGRESRWSAAGQGGQQPPLRPGINGDARRMSNGGTVRTPGDNSTGGAATPSMNGSGASGGRGAQMGNGSFPPPGGFIAPFPIRPPPPPPPPRNSGPSTGSTGAPPLPRGAGPVRPPMHAHASAPPYPHDSPTYPSAPPSAAYTQPPPTPCAAAPAPPLPGSSPAPPHSPLYPMHSYPPSNGMTHPQQPPHMHDFSALPPSAPLEDPPPPTSDAQPPLPPEPEPEPVPPPPPFYPVDVQAGMEAVKKRSQEGAPPAPCMQSMVGVPSSVTQLLNLGLYDAARLFIRRHHHHHHHHHGSQRRNA